MAGDEVASPKLARPRLERIHPRSDLLYLLDQLRAAPLIIVSGLPGAGKSELVASYAQTRNLPSLWYDIDHHDADLTTFFSHFSVGTRQFVSLKRIDLPKPDVGCLNGDIRAIRAYFSELFHCMFTPFLMVFDNFQEIPEGALLHQVIREACAMLPPGGRIILIARNEQPPVIASLRASRSTVIIGWQELQLHPEKVKELAALQDLSLPAEDMANQLRRRVAPWAATLVMSLQAPRCP